MSSVGEAVAHYELIKGSVILYKFLIMPLLKIQIYKKY